MSSTVLLLYTEHTKILDIQGKQLGRNWLAGSIRFKASAFEQFAARVVHPVSLHRGHKLTITSDRFLTADNCLSYEDNTWSLKIKLES